MKTKTRGFSIKLLFALLAIVLSLTLTACFGDEDETTTTTTTAAVSGSLSLSLSQTSVKSDNSDSTTITATVLDTNNAAIEAVTMRFSSTAGQLSVPSAETDTNGQAEVTFSSGTSDKSNQVATITATVSGLDPRQIPVQITGSTITLFTP